MPCVRLASGALAPWVAHRAQPACCGRIVFPIIVLNTQNFIQQPDPNYRRAALTILAVAAEGYSASAWKGAVAGCADGGQVKRTINSMR